VDWVQLAPMSHLAQTAAQALVNALGPQPPALLDQPQARPASVLLPLWEVDGRAQVVFTKRNSRLPHHAGQISFPGGAVEDGDSGPEETALRETCEEIGACRRAAKVVARLDQVVTVTNFLVTPFVGVLHPGVELNPNPEEVERLVVVPLAKVLDRGAWRPTEVRWQGMAFQHDALSHEGDIVWGATARIVMNLLDRLGSGAREVVAAVEAA